MTSDPQTANATSPLVAVPPSQQPGTAALDPLLCTLLDVAQSVARRKRERAATLGCTISEQALT